MTNLQSAIEKALTALQPSEYVSKATGETIVSEPAYVGPFRRSVIAELVAAAQKYDDLLGKRSDPTPTSADVMEAYKETVL